MKKVLLYIAVVFYTITNAQNNLYPIVDPEFFTFLETNHPETIFNDSLNLDSLSEITVLDINNTSINDLEGLQFFEDLVELSIYSNSVLTTIPSLNELSSLSYLNIYNNDGIQSLPWLTFGLTNLSQCNIQGNENLTEIIIGNLPNLTELSISGNASLTSIPLLTELSNLTELSISSNVSLTSIPALSGLS
ncbi:MAG: leucine-rich repeat domain-containing protein, partial [Candidatus Marinimicrobia bacterium]|nr:leucine-rich repeat domain-containing protein [Candidatus Neomarinimicrobiota bacterium]